MAFIHTTDAAEAEGAVAALYQRQQAAWGYVPDYATVFCHRPEVMARWAALLAEIRRPMDARRFELVTLVAAHELRHSACSLAHGHRLREFHGDADVAAIAEGRASGQLTQAEDAMLRFARQIARDASRVSQAQVDELKALGFSDAELFDIAAVAAGRAFFTKLLDALGVQADAPLLALDGALRDTLTVGRPIALRPPQVMPVPPHGPAES
jgi:uncharacterized peroxidase-related enzyme